MITEAKLAKIVAAFAQYNIILQTDGLMVTRLNQREVSFDASTYMTDQFIKLITDVLADQINQDVWGLL